MLSRAKNSLEVNSVVSAGAEIRVRVGNTDNASPQFSTEGFLPLGQLPWISKCSYEIGSYPKLNNTLEEGGKSRRVALSSFQAGQIWHHFIC